MRIVKGPCLIDIGPNPSSRASRRRAHIKHKGQYLWYCLSGKVFDSSSLLPETSSRVSLASLGNVFQTEKDGNINQCHK